ncbi:MAG TPA: hypothetical protein VHE37_12015 [Nevskiaceae bacterium]|nr:hypothetical protein [Nevskiaceae bacterium]
MTFARESSPLSFGDSARSAWIVATGPSATALPKDLHPPSTIAVNDAWQLVPDAAACYAGDIEWWRQHGALCARGFTGERWTSANPAADYLPVRQVSWRRGNTMPPEPGCICFGAGAGKSSTLQAMSLAVLWGAGRLVLVGVDLGVVGGMAHFFGEHPPALRKRKSHFEHQRRAIGQLACDLAGRGIQVINLSPHSRICGTTHPEQP